jgi:hypothetical protein
LTIPISTLAAFCLAVEALGKSSVFLDYVSKVGPVKEANIRSSSARSFLSFHKSLN